MVCRCGNGMPDGNFGAYVNTSLNTSRLINFAVSVHQIALLDQIQCK